MSCSPCSFVKPVPICVQQIIIGTISSIDANIYVFVKNVTTGKEIRLSTITDGAGLITLDVSGLTFSDSFTYEFKAILQTAVSINDVETITIGVDSDTCWAVPFVTIEDSNQDIINYVTITLEEV